VTFEPVQDPDYIFPPGVAPHVEVQQDVYILVKCPVFGYGDVVDKLVTSVQRQMQVSFGDKFEVSRLSQADVDALT